MNLTIVLGMLGGCAGLLALVKLLQVVWRVNKRIVKIADAVTELSPNSGHSIKDTVHRTESKVDRTKKKVDQTRAMVDVVARRLDEHISNHPGG